MELAQIPVTTALITANVLYSFVGFSNADVMDKTIMWPYRVKREKQYYRFLTSGFLHADFMHLLFNMITLYFFGGGIEFYFSFYGLGGTFSYLLLYVLGLVVSDLPSYRKHQDNYHYRSLGASGAVSAVVFACIIFNPWAKIYFGLSMFLYAILYVIYCVMMGRRGQDNINHDAHLWGSIFGLIFSIVLVALMQPSLFGPIIENFKNPSLIGR